MPLSHDEALCSCSTPSWHAGAGEPTRARQPAAAGAPSTRSVLRKRLRPAHGRSRSEPARRARCRCRSRLEHRVESPLGKTRSVSVPRCGNRVPDPDDLLALVVPGVEKELRVLGDHAPEQSLQDGPLVDERRVRSRKALRVREFAGPLGTRRKIESHVMRSLARPLHMSPAELCPACSGEHVRTLAQASGASRGERDPACREITAVELVCRLERFASPLRA